MTREACFIPKNVPSRSTASVEPAFSANGANLSSHTDDSGIVDHAVQLTEFANGPIHSRGYIFLSSDIGQDKYRRAQFSRERFTLVSLPICDQQPGAFARKQPSRCLAYSARGARDQRYPTIQPSRHESPLAIDAGCASIRKLH